MSGPRYYDSTVARIAGNLLSGVACNRLSHDEKDSVVNQAVRMARLIVAETRRTEPAPPLRGEEGRSRERKERSE